MVANDISRLSVEEATEIVKKIAHSTRSVDEIRNQLTKAGFDGPRAAIATERKGLLFMAMITVSGPGGKVISV
ncbi:hypothetical protein L6270_03935 [Candidatus Parcubacteria bacterium]|nr:hypothetical protein [Patescibacteria group bacterium]MBU4309114.1 hypothetical protein [Patescibacteria group bacterium]MBU4432710.1 hypothetical protein [Patescibacteria group bacterium]MBU4577475.1 hypothetical protein [Patescibacteria group bacterium]MCG2697163.1 hypothetical protein [Candidatus Parcubacteria bacterium]